MFLIKANTKLMSPLAVMYSWQYLGVPGAVPLKGQRSLQDLWKIYGRAASIRATTATELLKDNVDRSVCWLGLVGGFFLLT